MRITLNLLADLFAMFAHQYASSPEEVDAMIEQFRAPLLTQIPEYRRQQE